MITNLENMLNVLAGTHKLCPRCLGLGKYLPWQEMHGKGQCVVCSGLGYADVKDSMHWRNCNARKKCDDCNR